MLTIARARRPQASVLVHEKVVSFLSEGSAYQSAGALPAPAERSPFLMRLVCADAQTGPQSQIAQISRVSTLRRWRIADPFYARIQSSVVAHMQDLMRFGRSQIRMFAN